MNYKIVINIPNENHPTEVLITEEQMQILEPVMNTKRIMKINNSYFNTSYIAKIVPDAEANLIENSKTLQLEQTPQTQQDKNTREAIEELKKKLFNKNIVN